MAGKNSIFHYCIIILFSAGIVLIGVHDVNRSFSTSEASSQVRARQLFDELRGSGGLTVRGSLAREAAPREASSKGEKSTFFEMLVGEGRSSDGKQEKRLDTLEKKDREQLDSLVDSVWQPN